MRVAGAAAALTIDAETNLQVPQGLQSSHTAVSFGHFHRRFTLSKALDTANVSAEFAQGMLRLRLRMPKAEHAQPRCIEISTF